jgi:hypothetical protein
MRIITRYFVLLALLLLVVSFLLPAIFRGSYPHPAGPSFDRQVSKLYLREIEAQHPSIVLLGDSILTKGVEKELLEEMIGEPVYKLDIPGSSSALWYLVLKSNIAPVSPAPRSLVILFRDTLLTAPTFRTLPPYFGMIDKFAPPGDALLLERAYLAQMTPLQIALEGYFPIYTYRAELRESVDSGLRHALPAVIGCDRSCADDNMTNVLGDIQPEIFARSILLAEQGNYTDEQLDFSRQVDGSFLPEIIRLAGEAHIQLILVRAPTNLFPDPAREPASLETYMADMHDYLAGQGVPLIDLSRVEGIGPAQFSDPHHLSVDGKAIFTRVLAEALKNYLNEFKPKDL